jgi:hypothetical protein
MCSSTLDEGAELNKESGTIKEEGIVYFKSAKILKQNVGLNSRVRIIQSGQVHMIFASSKAAFQIDCLSVAKS